VTDLRTAINRIGYNMVRSASISFSMAQISQEQQTSRPGAPPQRSLATQYRGSCFRLCAGEDLHQGQPDEAMLTGMMHGIGKLYVLTRVIDHPELFARQHHAEPNQRMGMPGALDDPIAAL